MPIFKKKTAAEKAAKKKAKVVKKSAKDRKKLNKLVDKRTKKQVRGKSTKKVQKKINKNKTAQADKKRADKILSKRRKLEKEGKLVKNRPVNAPEVTVKPKRKTKPKTKPKTESTPSPRKMSPKKKTSKQKDQLGPTKRKAERAASQSRKRKAGTELSPVHYMGKPKKSRNLSSVVKRAAVRAGEAYGSMGLSELVRAFPKTASKVGLKKSNLASERYNRYQQKSKVKGKRK